MNIITGEKIQDLCDYYIGTRDDFNFNPFIRQQYKKQINIDNIDLYNIKTLNISRIFCYTHLINGTLYEKYKDILFQVLSDITTQFSLIFHNSDGQFNELNLELFNIKNITNIYSQNINVPIDNSFIINKKLAPVPIGIANSMWEHGNLSIWNIILNDANLSINNKPDNKPDNKPNNIYMNFNINTNFIKRQECLNIMLTYNIPNVPNTDYYNYLKLLSTYKFAICPEGNGIDTHRFWECLYLKTIPICLKNTVTLYYSKLFPIILLDNWNDLNLDKLNDNFYNSFIWDSIKLEC